jgi:hypothetical protein
VESAQAECDLFRREIVEWSKAQSGDRFNAQMWRNWIETRKDDEGMFGLSESFVCGLNDNVQRC